MSERERQTLVTMQDRIDAYDGRRLGLARLVGDLELLLSLLEAAPEQWRTQFRQQWAILEETYAVALDRELQIDSAENRREIAPALATMRHLLFRLMPIQVPYAFIRSRVRLTWADVLYGLEAGSLPPPCVAEVAIDKLMEGATKDGVAELAANASDTQLYEIVRQLACEESVSNTDVPRRKWAFLTIAWSIEHLGREADDAEVIRKVYEDLGNPRAMDPVVQSMTSENRESLRQRLAEYVRAESIYFDPSKNCGVSETHPGTHIS